MCTHCVFTVFEQKRRRGEGRGRSRTGMLVKTTLSQSPSSVIYKLCFLWTSVVLSAQFLLPPFLVTGFTSILSLCDLGAWWVKGCRCDAIWPRTARPRISSGVIVKMMFFSHHIYRGNSYNHGSADGHLAIKRGGLPADEANTEESRAERWETWIQPYLTLSISLYFLPCSPSAEASLSCVIFKHNYKSWIIHRSQIGHSFYEPWVSLFLSNRDDDDDDESDNDHYNESDNNSLHGVITKEPNEIITVNVLRDW